MIAPKLDMVLNAKAGKKFNGVPIISFSWRGAPNQRRKLNAKGPFYALINQKTGLALDLKDNVQ